ncbi:Pimeloyl-ACP methyl ester carboxylesterase [Halogranum amylolyticum]|uniref:Pimeloyl-ACP methyl ester carboxylesterase n=1 Tax=Halogranum amylolyticum TaxID=660520 RepID=A0A1H8T8A3_9EURY|nr:alpha/beta fold hydrolase [Halogranum amylolyticum]SEO86976.1 Pimeloyl-ACP methyl ester carboxylesterase [Halogranum amylolyticum]
MSRHGSHRDLSGATTRRVFVGDHDVFYHVAGDGPPVVLLHGGGWDAAALSWRETVPALAETHTVYAPDLPGYGGSDPLGETPTTSSYGAFVVDFLDAIGVDAAALVGLSLGGSVALDVALSRPERVSRLVLVDSYGLGGTVPGGSLGALFVRIPRMAEAIEGLLARHRRLTALGVRGIVHPVNLTPELVDDVWAVARDHDGRAWRAFQRNEVGFGGLRTNYVDRLPDLSVPTLLVHGEQDALVPADWTVRAGTLIPDAEVRILPQCGHWPPRERPDRFTELVGGFLASAAQSNSPVDM